MELNEKDLENIMGGIPTEMVDEISLENKNLYRKEQIDKLKEQRDFLIAMKNTEPIEDKEEINVPNF